MTMDRNYHSSSQFQRVFQQPQDEAREHFSGQLPVQYENDAPWYPQPHEVITSLSSDWITQYGTPFPSAQSVDGFPQLPRHGMDQTLEPGPMDIDERPLEPVGGQATDSTMEDFMDLLKPAAEEWRPPMLPDDTNLSHGHLPDARPRDSGIYAGCRLNQETCSTLGSDRVDSGYYSGRASVDEAPYKQDPLKEDALTFPALSAPPVTAIGRPPNGERLPNGQRSTSHGKKRRSSEPLATCSLCPTFKPITRSQVVYAILPIFPYHTY